MVVQTLLNIKSEIENIAALKVHSHNNAKTNADGFMSKEDKVKLNNIDDNANNFTLTVDNSLNSDSTNPVTNKLITEKYNELKNKTIEIEETVNPLSTDKAVCGKAVANYTENIKQNIEDGTAKNPKSTGAFNSFDEIFDSGIYDIEGATTTIPNGGKTIDVTNGYLTVKKTASIQTQNIIAPNGIEYSRWRNVNNTKWNDWKIYYMPYRQYTEEYTPNTDVYNFQIMENTAGFTIIWNQGSSKDKNYFVTSSTAEAWKHVVLFKTPLPIDGAFTFGNLLGDMDIMITGGHYDGYYEKTFASGVWIRSPKASNRIRGIHEAYFVPRNN